MRFLSCLCILSCKSFSYGQDGDDNASPFDQFPMAVMNEEEDFLGGNDGELTLKSALKKGGSKKTLLKASTIHFPGDIEEGSKRTPIARRSMLSASKANRKKLARSSRASVAGGKRSSVLYSLIHGHKVDDGKTRILALCGRQSNETVTKMQLDNLQITSDKYHITYMHGPIFEDKGDPDVTGLVNGPFYSWFLTNESDPKFKPSVLYAVECLLKEIQAKGPFEAIYGFSQGAALATIVAAAHQDSIIRRGIVSNHNSIHWGFHGEVLAVVETPEELPEQMTVNQDSSAKRENKSFTGSSSLKGRLSSIRGSISRRTFRGSVVEITDDLFETVPFPFMVLVCAAGLSNGVLQAIGIDKDYLEPGSIEIASMHLLGTEDPLRQEGEDMLALFTESQMRYMIGGHGVPRHIESDKDTLHMLHEGLLHLYNSVGMQFSKAVKISDMSSVSPMHGYQVAGVDLNNLMHRATIPKMLAAQDPNKPFLYNARETDVSNFLSYGNLLDFIEGGAGDLRRLGVREGEVVAYGGPGNGGK